MKIIVLHSTYVRLDTSAGLAQMSSNVQVHILYRESKTTIFQGYDI